MFSAINTGLSGLLGFSEGLNVLSNNISNLNSPGFKASELIFRDLFYRARFGGGSGAGNFGLQVGEGLATGPTSIRFKQGDLRETGNTLDTAINGNGFFVLRNNGEISYSRAGQFEYDNDGYLVEKGSRARVAALLGNSQLTDISINELRVNAAKATSRINFTGILATGNTPYVVNNVTVYDAAGTARQLKVTFTFSAPVTWNIEVRDPNDAVVTTGEIRFQTNGSPATGFNTFAFTYTPDASTTLNVTLNFGDPGSFTGTTSFSGATGTAAVSSQDGFAAGALIESSIDENGYLKLKYSNNQNVTGPRLALAWFDSLNLLTPVGGNIFKNDNNQPIRVQGPGEGVMGKLVSGRIELSNVELTEQFTDMVVIQRGFQASSQVVSISNELIQTLLDLRGRR